MRAERDLDGRRPRPRAPRRGLRVHELRQHPLFVSGVTQILSDDIICPVAPEEDVASAASVKMTGHRCWRLRDGAIERISLPCIRNRCGQNSSASRRLHARRRGSPSVITSTCEQSSGTSVNGLPIMMPAAIAVPSRSIRRHSPIKSP